MDPHARSGENLNFSISRKTWSVMYMSALVRMLLTQENMRSKEYAVQNRGDNLKRC